MWAEQTHESRIIPKDVPKALTDAKIDFSIAVLHWQKWIVHARISRLAWFILFLIALRVHSVLCKLRQNNFCVRRSSGDQETTLYFMPLLWYSQVRRHSKRLSDQRTRSQQTYDTEIACRSFVAVHLWLCSQFFESSGDRQAILNSHARALFSAVQFTYNTSLRLHIVSLYILGNTLAGRPLVAVYLWSNRPLSASSGDFFARLVARSNVASRSCALHCVCVAQRKIVVGESTVKGWG